MEWRLYPSLLFFALGLSSLIPQRLSVERSLTVKLKNPALIYSSLLILAGVFLTIRQNHIYSNIERTYQQVLSKYPSSAVAENSLGYYYFRIANYQKAEQHFNRSIELQPSYKRPIANLYLLYQRTGETERATLMRKKLGRF